MYQQQDNSSHRQPQGGGGGFRSLDTFNNQKPREGDDNFVPAPNSLPGGGGGDQPPQGLQLNQLTLGGGPNSNNNNNNQSYDQQQQDRESAAAVAAFQRRGDQSNNLDYYNLDNNYNNNNDPYFQQPPPVQQQQQQVNADYYNSNNNNNNNNSNNNLVYQQQDQHNLYQTDINQNNNNNNYFNQQYDFLQVADQQQSLFPAVPGPQNSGPSHQPEFQNVMNNNNNQYQPHHQPISSSSHDNNFGGLYDPNFVIPGPTNTNNNNINNVPPPPVAAASGVFVDGPSSFMMGDQQQQQQFQQVYGGGDYNVPQPQQEQFQVQAPPHLHQYEPHDHHHHQQQQQQQQQQPEEQEKVKEITAAQAKYLPLSEEEEEEQKAKLGPKERAKTDFEAAEKEFQHFELLRCCLQFSYPLPVAEASATAEHLKAMLVFMRDMSLRGSHHSVADALVYRVIESDDDLDRLGAWYLIDALVREVRKDDQEASQKKIAAAMEKSLAATAAAAAAAALAASGGGAGGDDAEGVVVAGNNNNNNNNNDGGDDVEQNNNMFNNHLDDNAEKNGGEEQEKEGENSNKKPPSDDLAPILHSLLSEANLTRLIECRWDEFCVQSGTVKKAYSVMRRTWLETLAHDACEKLRASFEIARTKVTLQMHEDHKHQIVTASKDKDGTRKICTTLTIQTRFALHHNHLEHIRKLRIKQPRPSSCYSVKYAFETKREKPIRKDFDNSSSSSSGDAAAGTLTQSNLKKQQQQHHLPYLTNANDSSTGGIVAASGTFRGPGGGGGGGNQDSSHHENNNYENHNNTTIVQRTVAAVIDRLVPEVPKKQEEQEQQEKQKQEQQQTPLLHVHDRVRKWISCISPGGQSHCRFCDVWDHSAESCPCKTSYSSSFSQNQNNNNNNVSEQRGKRGGGGATKAFMNRQEAHELLASAGVSEGSLQALRNVTDLQDGALATTISPPSSASSSSNNADDGDDYNNNNENYKDIQNQILEKGSRATGQVLDCIYNHIVRKTPNWTLYMDAFDAVRRLVSEPEDRRALVLLASYRLPPSQVVPKELKGDVSETLQRARFVLTSNRRFAELLALGGVCTRLFLTYHYAIARMKNQSSHYHLVRKSLTSAATSYFTNRLSKELEKIGKDKQQPLLLGGDDEGENILYAVPPSLTSGFAAGVLKGDNQYYFYCGGLDHLRPHDPTCKLPLSLSSAASAPATLRLMSYKSFYIYKKNMQIFARLEDQMARRGREFFRALCELEDKYSFIFCVTGQNPAPSVPILGFDGLPLFQGGRAPEVIVQAARAEEMIEGSSSSASPSSSSLEALTWEQIQYSTAGSLGYAESALDGRPFLFVGTNRDKHLKDKEAAKENRHKREKEQQHHRQQRDRQDPRRYVSADMESLEYVSQSSILRLLDRTTLAPLSGTSWKPRPGSHNFNARFEFFAKAEISEKQGFLGGEGYLQKVIDWSIQHAVEGEMKTDVQSFPWELRNFVPVNVPRSSSSSSTSVPAVNSFSPFAFNVNDDPDLQLEPWDFFIAHGHLRNNKLPQPWDWNNENFRSELYKAVAVLQNKYDPPKNQQQQQQQQRQQNQQQQQREQTMTLQGQLQALQQRNNLLIAVWLLVKNEVPICFSCGQFGHESRRCLKKFRDLICDVAANDYYKDGASLDIPQGEGHVVQTSIHARLNLKSYEAEAQQAERAYFDSNERYKQQQEKPEKDTNVDDNNYNADNKKEKKDLVKLRRRYIDLTRLVNFYKEITINQDFGVALTFLKEFSLTFGNSSSSSSSSSSSLLQLSGRNSNIKNKARITPALAYYFPMVALRVLFTHPDFKLGTKSTRRDCEQLAITEQVRANIEKSIRVISTNSDCPHICMFCSSLEHDTRSCPHARGLLIEKQKQLEEEEARTSYRASNYRPPQQPDKRQEEPKKKSMTPFHHLFLHLAKNHIKVRDFVFAIVNAEQNPRLKSLVHHHHHNHPSYYENEQDLLGGGGGVGGGGRSTYQKEEFEKYRKELLDFANERSFQPSELASQIAQRCTRLDDYRDSGVGGGSGIVSSSGGGGGGLHHSHHRLWDKTIEESNIRSRDDHLVQYTYFCNFISFTLKHAQQEDNSSNDNNNNSSLLQLGASQPLQLQQQQQTQNQRGSYNQQHQVPSYLLTTSAATGLAGGGVTSTTSIISSDSKAAFRGTGQKLTTLKKVSSTNNSNNKNTNTLDNHNNAERKSTSSEKRRRERESQDNDNHNNIHHGTLVSSSQHNNNNNQDEEEEDEGQDGGEKQQLEAADANDLLGMLSDDDEN